MTRAVRQSHAARTERSREALTRAAAQLFTQHGFAGTGTESILTAAGLTRGALYHHFRDKRDLFDAVCQRLHADIVQAIDLAAEAHDDPLDGLVAGCLAFVDQVARPESCRILLIDAPAVLGWTRWNDLDRAHGFGRLMEGVREAVQAEVLSGDPEVLAHLLNGALNQAVVWAAQSDEPDAMTRVRCAVREMLQAMRVRPAGVPPADSRRPGPSR